MPKLGMVLMVAVVAVWVGGWVPPAFAKPALVEVTGQATSFADGDDGEIQAGVPFPTPRFSDKGNGTVKDNLTNLTWLKNANCFVFQTWVNALSAANNLADDPASTTTDCGLSDGSVAGDWRLPNVKELQSLIDFGFFSSALSNAAGTAKCTATDCAFSGVQSAGYWSSTTYADNSGFAWLVSLTDGNPDVVGKGSTVLGWPVRGGQ